MTLLFAPALSICHAKESEEDVPLILIGYGSNVDVFTLKSDESVLHFVEAFKVFAERGSLVYGIVKIFGTDAYLVYGEKSLSFLCFPRCKQLKQKIITLHHWILSASSLTEQEIAVLLMNNTVMRYRIFWNDCPCSAQVEQYSVIHCSPSAVLLHSILDGCSWADLRSITGTVFGEILISHPGRSTEVEHRLVGHKGMIFGLHICGKILFSISDDRSLRMWSLEDYCELDEVYGHSSRPFAICGGPLKTLFTAEHSGAVCFWSYTTSSLHLCEKITIGRGAIRSLQFVGPCHLILGTETGFVGTVRMPIASQPSNLISRFSPSPGVSSFVSVSPETTYFLDCKGYFGCSNSELSRIQTSEEYQRLSLSPDGRFLCAFSAHNYMLYSVLEKRILCENSIRSGLISSVLLTDFHVFIHFSNTVIHFAIVEGDLQKCQTLTVCKKDKITAAVHVKKGFFIGTRTGSILALSSEGITAEQKNCHGTDGISDLWWNANQPLLLYSLGRDGNLSLWRILVINGNLSIVELTHTPPSIFCDMEWPAKFHFFAKKLYISGFHGSNFLLVDVDSGHCLCSVECGGGHRVWQLSFNELSGLLTDANQEFARLQFISKGALECYDIYLHSLKIIKPNAHTSTMSAVVVVESNSLKTCIVTAGYDTFVVLTCVDVSGSTLTTHHSKIHTSSVHALSVCGNFVLSAGGKSETILHKYADGKLTTISSMKLKGDCRIVSVQLLYYSRHLYYVASCSDSRLMICEMKDDLHGTNKHCALLASQDVCCTKLSCVSNSRTLYVIAVSTSGLVLRWIFCGEELPSMLIASEKEVEAVGLSAVHSVLNNDCLLLVVGSESGRITVLEWKDCERQGRIMAYNQWHSAACCDLRLFLNDDRAFIVSLGADCRLALFAYESVKKKIDFLRAITVSVGDPLSLALYKSNDDERMNAVVAGSSIQTCFGGVCSRILHWYFI
ncbi:hypothetical protein AB6A40_002269 [Gnathostoma spinigerum]|uniref:tRNA (34-2'-O)-methyltransferase regulator WDR6 n=1 Tax=Gnathostoma spinigerum TaxID=75299 RepID=A0ABD6E653_9BILA